MPHRGGERPPPRAGNDLSIFEPPTRKLTTEFNDDGQSSQGAGRLTRERLACLAQAIHRLGERPRFELLIELDRGAEFHSVLESYARLSADFIAALDGDRLCIARPLIGDGGRDVA